MEKQAVEFEVSAVAIDEKGNVSHQLEGMKLCEGCSNFFVLCELTYCSSCARMLNHYEGQSKPRPQQPNRMEMGVVPYDPDYDPQPPSRRACFMFAGLILIFIGFAATGMWYAGRSLVGLWQHGW